MESAQVHDPSAGSVVAPLSFAQARLWMLAELHPASHAYNLRIAYTIAGELDRAALVRSLEEIVRRHEALRTTFDVVDGEPVQIVTSHVEVHLPVYDLSDIAASERQSTLERRLYEEGSRPFNLRRGPLMRHALFRVGPRKHVLQTVIHHIVFDDGSFPPFNHELTTLYRAYHRGIAHDLPPLPIQYPDFAVWQRGSLHGDDLRQQLEYWRTQLAGAPPRVELPLDRPRPGIQRFRGAVRSIALAAPLAERVRALGKTHGTTVFMTLLAAFNVLLYRYTGQRDLVVGSPIANRTRTELEPLVGFFVNTLALRTRLSGDLRFIDLLRSVRETAISAYENQDVAFEHVVAELHPERSLSGTPIVNVMFFVRAFLGEPLELDGLRLERFPLESTNAKFDLSLRVTDNADGFACSLQYDVDLFDAAKIDALLRHFATLVEGIVAAPETPIANLPMLSAAERERILVDWNSTATSYDGDNTLAELFEGQAARAPDAVAVAAAGATVSYRELNARANRLAAELRARGAAAGDTIGIGVDRSIAMIVATLAVAKIGGVYLPLDADYPPERVALMLRDTNARAVIAQRGRFTTIAAADSGFVAIDADAPGIALHSAENVPAQRSSDDVAYVMYTSGSTGRPKGVPITGRAVSRLVTGTQYVRIGAADVVAQVSNFSFDAVTFELWGALLHGARLEIIARDVILSAPDFAATLASTAVSVMFLTASLFRQTAAAIPTAFRGLRCLIVGGEKPDPAAVRAVLELGAPGQLLNGYGPTESTTFACTYEISPPVPELIPIGRPISNTQAYILDADGNPLPPGVPGQLYLGGPGLAKGYLNDAELTARKFIPHPFSEAAGARLYATGDLARYRSDGNIEFLGRVDRQIKLRGFRIELGEIETALKRLPGVRDAVVAVQTDDFGDRRLAAYVIDDGPPKPGPETWRKQLAATLPEYMLPNVVVTVAAFPLNANGKVDVGALPDPRAVSTERSEHELDDPRHQQLVGLWRDLLGFSDVGLRDNFFDVGGHSLLATRLIGEVSNVFGRRVSLSEFLTDPTIEHLAMLLSGEDDAAGSRSPLLQLRSGSKTPFFFFHGDVTGGGYYAQRLVRNFERDQPFYVLPPHGMGGSPLPSTIEEMASDYVELIREARPHGPYIFGGFSGGGLVAFEVARRFQAVNEPVANVILLDAPGLRGQFSALVEVVDWAAALLRIDERRRVRAYARAARFVRAAFLELRAAWRLRNERRLTEQLAHLLFGRSKGLATHELQEPPLLAAWRRIIEGYIPRRYHGPVTLLLPEENRASRSASIAGWKSVAGALSIKVVPGDHLSCVTRYVNDTAAVFSEQLAGGEP